MNTCPGYRIPATTMKPATESTHHLQREDTEIETVPYLNYDTYSYGCQTYARTMQPATESTHHLQREDTEIETVPYLNYDTYSYGCQTYATTMQPATESTHHLQREKGHRGLHGAYIWTMTRTVMAVRHMSPPYSQPQKARTTCREKKDTEVYMVLIYELWHVQ